MNTSSGRHRKQDTGDVPPVLAPGTEDVLAPVGQGVPGDHAADANITDTEHGSDSPDDPDGPGHAEGGAGRLSAHRHRPARRGVGGERAGGNGRRSPWNRRGDRIAVALIAVVSLTTGLLIWAFSDNRATSQEVAGPAPALPPAPGEVPAQLAEIWRADSQDTPLPVAEQNSVITASGGEVAGRDPLTGEIRWRYARDLQLCTVSGSWDRVLAVYRKDAGCSEVTQLDADSGKRTAQRNGDAELGTRLVGDGDHVTTTGKHLLNTWRSDLVKSMEYGQVYAPQNPEKQPRTGCVYSSVAAAAGKVGVIERCENDGETASTSPAAEQPAAGDRLTVLKAASEEADEPEELFSTLLPGAQGVLVAMSADHSAVAMPDANQLAVFDGDGNVSATYPLDLPAPDLARQPPQGVAPTSEGVRNLYWFTGSRTVALARNDLAPQWTLEDSLGPGTLFAGQYVVPIAGGLAVLDERTGATIRTIGVDRQGYTGPVELASAGPVLLEQRGDTVVALR
ncbi:hypothetical protein BAY61_04245 [Prauserella marina]|uniref:Uncharacterized protein n=1 Tax=Prauserella marina TaxID=530584 RepID=A0A222VKI7_9PSEU|nr:hypothetical protein [Prauserella marina]ASR34332.1 hypothetical protein BAY61_04245 [Prauserella marina]PWV71880.1 hypothetical protein DES30_11151 [Prauserella marina]SDD89918.1 hypothetical protein SAMN05421630_11450 [Prauserella marina]